MTRDEFEKTLARDILKQVGLQIKKMTEEDFEQIEPTSSAMVGILDALTTTVTLSAHIARDPEQKIKDLGDAIKDYVINVALESYKRNHKRLEHVCLECGACGKGGERPFNIKPSDGGIMH